MDLEAIRLWQRRWQTDRAAQAVHHPKWKRAIQLFDTSYWDALKADNPDVIEVNYSTTFITTLVSAVFARAPRWRIEAKRPGRFYEMAQTMQILMEQFKDEAKFKDLGLRCVVDAALCNIGWVEQGFFASIDQPMPEPETGEDESGLMRRMGQLFKQLTQDTPETPAQQGELHEQKVPGQFYLVRRNPWNVLKPVGCYEFESMPYLIVLEQLLWTDFLKNPRYKNQERYGSLLTPSYRQKISDANMRGNHPGSLYNERRPVGKQDRDPDRQIEIAHIWDRRSDSYFTISETCDEPHEEPIDWPYLGEGFPQKPLQFNYVPEVPDVDDNFYGFADLDPIMAQVLEKSDLRTQQNAIRKRAIVKVFVQSGSATESQLAKLASPDIEIIPVQNIQAINVSPPIQIPPAVLQVEDRIDSDLSRDSGMGILLADATQQAQIDRATVANIAQQTASVKSSYKVDRIEAWVKAIGLYQVGLFWQFLTRDEVGERLGKLPSPTAWISLPLDLQLARQWIAKELLLTVEAGSTKPMTADIVERDQYFKSCAIIQATSPLLWKQIEKQALAIGVKKFNEPALEQLVLNAMDEETQQVALMENQLMLQGHPQVIDPHEDHEVHIKLHLPAGQHPIVAAHIQAHQIRLQELAQGQKTAGQGVRQENAAQSPAEMSQGGHPSGMDVQGAAMKSGSTASQAQANA